MTAPILCPDEDRLLSMLDCELDQPQQGEVTDHVNECITCQSRLETLVTRGLREDLEFDHLATHLRDGLSDIDSLISTDDIGQMTKTVLSVDAHPGPIISLDFLQPSDSPDSLGRLGQYEIIEVIGRGGMGIALKARDTRLDRIVAVKVLAPELASNPTARKRFLREAKAAAAVCHDHVVTVHAVEPADLPYLAMEYIDGYSLRQKIDREGPLPVQEILRISLQTARGLAAAHGQGLIHHDIKPANILLQNGIERVQITDFGLARAVDDVTITRTGEVRGTPQYMSPEQARGESTDPRSDLFSLGAAMYTMCTGREPFRGTSTMGVLHRVCNDKPREIHEINPEIPEWLVRIIHRLLEKNREDRFQAAEEVADLLEQCLAHLQQPTAVPLPALARPSTKAQPSRRKWYAGAIAAMMLLVGLGMSEATGVTGLAGTVLRITLGEGTLVIEVDDPTVEVSLDGEELSISGAGIQELKLRPGQYRFRAMKDGTAVKQELVTITRGGRQLVRVVREAGPVASAIRLDQPQPQTTDAFAVLSTAGKRIAKFNTLAEAVTGSTPGDTIEIRGNGPFATDPIEIKHPLTIRGAEGYRPVIRGTPRNPEYDEKKSWPIIAARSELSLENLVVQRTKTPHDLRFVFAIYAWAPLRMVNCRVCVDANGAAVWCYDDNPCALRNCELSVRHGCVFGSSRGGNAELENNVLLGTLAAKYVRKTSHELRLKNNTLCSPDSEVIEFSPALDVRVAGTHGAPANRYRMHASGNIFDHPTNVFTIIQNSQAKYPYDFNEARAWLPRFMSWNEEGNLYNSDVGFLNYQVEGDYAPHDPNSPIKTLVDWNQYWGLHNTGSTQGIVRYVGGDVRKKFWVDSETVTAEDFRLRPDSAGYQAGPNGEDLGANVDFVGPGEAYERWKRTPEYQQWQKETRELMTSAEMNHQSTNDPK